MGGTVHPSSNTTANGLYLCLGCHFQIAERRRDMAEDMGWLVPQGKNPAEVPVLLHDGWWTLDVAGKRHRGAAA